jgi:hypothetical protein
VTMERKVAREKSALVPTSSVATPSIGPSATTPPSSPVARPSRTLGSVLRTRSAAGLSPTILPTRSPGALSRGSSAAKAVQPWPVPKEPNVTVNTLAASRRRRTRTPPRQQHRTRGTPNPEFLLVRSHRVDHYPKVKSVHFITAPPLRHRDRGPEHVLRRCVPHYEVVIRR